MAFTVTDPLKQDILIIPSKKLYTHICDLLLQNALHPFIQLRDKFLSMQKNACSFLKMFVEGFDGVESFLTGTKVV